MNDMVRIFQSESVGPPLYNMANLRIMRKESKIRLHQWMKPRLFYPVRMKMKRKKTSLRPPQSQPTQSWNPDRVSLLITTLPMCRYYVRLWIARLFDILTYPSNFQLNKGM